MIRIILGSQSPRRKEILEFFNIPFTQATSNFDEDSIPFCGDPSRYACLLASKKALSLQPLYSNCAILTADTVVYRDGKSYGKPKDPEELFQTFNDLQGRWHSVFTGVCVLWNGVLTQEAEETKVLFNPLSEAQIQAYQRTLYWTDKAGGYGVQKSGSLLINRIEGCVHNLQGLPINTVRRLLEKIGINLWDYLKPSSCQ